jgi:glycosyltransferase involved in cell wall biosynthesis
MHIITRLIRGGAQQNTVTCCKAQVESGHQVQLVHGPIYGPEGSLADEADACGAKRIVVGPMRREVAPVKDIRCIGQLRKLIAEFKPDIVHTHSSKAGIVGRAAAWKQKVPGVIHTVHGLPFNDQQGRLKQKLFIEAERWAARRCHHLIGITDAMVDAFVDGKIASSAMFSVVPSGIPVSFWEAGGNSSCLTTRQELGIEADAKVVGLVGRLDPLKGHDDLIEIAPVLGKKFSKLHLLFVGDGWARERLMKRIVASGIKDQVVVTGLVLPQRVAELYRAMDVMVLPSYQEGQSRTLAEALLAGCPIVGYDVGGISAICKEMETGRLVSCGNHQVLAEAIEWTLENPGQARELQQAGAEHVKACFSETVMIEKLQRVYEQVLSKS